MSKSLYLEPRERYEYSHVMIHPQFRTSNAFISSSASACLDLEPPYRRIRGGGDGKRDRVAVLTGNFWCVSGLSLSLSSVLLVCRLVGASAATRYERRDPP
jgi:hypothetical protein